MIVPFGFLKYVGHSWGTIVALALAHANSSGLRRRILAIYSPAFRHSRPTYAR
jgi:pimeloyl-ACP methyl ester carboxylesterase